MTLGRKLSNYRKLAGLTQQQLGEKLNLSPQAISKWEKDLSEPDLSSLRALADIYGVSVDDLLRIDDATHEEKEEPAQPQPTLGQEEKNTTSQIGFCKSCGILVMPSNLGSTTPAVLCKNCLDRQMADRKAREEKIARDNAAYRERVLREENARKSGNSNRATSRHIWALCVAGVITLAFLIWAIVDSIPGGIEFADIAFAAIFGYIIFAFIYCLFFDCIVRDILFGWTGHAIRWPGLIFTFDIDGILWLIGMKLLFWILGLILGILSALFAFICAAVCAPFVLPFVLFNVHKARKHGIECKYLD